MTQTYRFGRCELRPSKRQLLVDGEVRPLERRPFDLLIHLLEHRDRVVSKEELLSAVWANEAVTVGVIARAIMKARVAIGDNNPDQPLIQTIARVGYRFAGHLLVDLPVEATQAGGVANEEIRLALLPFENHTGQHDLDWVPLGLMTVTARALSADPRMTVSDIPSVLTALGTVDESASLDERAAVLETLLGVKWVVHVSISQAQAPFYCLEYRVLGRTERAPKRLLDADPARLGQMLAAALEADFLPSERVPVPTMMKTVDPFANHAVIRALQAAGEQKWSVAANLLRAVLDIEPDNTAVQLEYLFALAPQGDDEALALSQQLLAQDKLSGSPARAAAVHQAIGRTYLNKGQLRQAREHLDTALRLDDGTATQDWREFTLLLHTTLAVEQRDFALVAELQRQASKLRAHSGNQMHRIWWQTGTAIVAAKTGALTRADALIRDVVQRCTEYRLHRNLAASSDSAARISTALGRLHSAVKFAEDAMAVAQSINDAYATAFAAETLCLLFRLMDQPEQAQNIMTAMDAFEPDAAEGPSANIAMARGQFHAGLHDHAQAALCMQTAVENFIATEEWFSAHDALPWLVMALVQSNQPESAKEWIARAGALPGFTADAELQAALLHGRALQARMSGDLTRARQLLARAIDTAPIGLWHAQACITAADLAADASDLAAARRLTRDLGHWLMQYPPGVQLAARLREPQHTPAAPPAAAPRLLARQ